MRRMNWQIRRANQEYIPSSEEEAMEIEGSRPLTRAQLAAMRAQQQDNAMAIDLLHQGLQGTVTRQQARILGLN